MKKEAKKCQLFLLMLLLFTSCKKENSPEVMTGEISKKEANVLDSIDVTSEYDTPFIIEDGDNYIFKRVLLDNTKFNVITKEFKVPKKDNVAFTVFIKHKNSKYNDFNVKLNPTQNFNTTEEWKTDDQIFAVSDFEGEFYHFVELLVAAQVIDRDYNWTFGKNHLVVLGDVFDRGDMVHECFWLLYKLESEGANIHYIHGNHDIMNISGNQTNYVHEKYFNTLKALDFEGIESLYKPTTVLGKWLRSKNIIEKGNDIVFAHGGVSKYLLTQYPNLTINYINSIAKRNFDTPKSAEATLFFSGQNAITWFRGYFQRSPIHSQSDVEEVLSHFNANMICVAHTIQKDAGLFYEGKVACTDVDIHKGYRQGLLFDKAAIFRIDASEGKMPYSKTQLR